MLGRCAFFVLRPSGINNGGSMSDIIYVSNNIIVETNYVLSIILAPAQTVRQFKEEYDYWSTGVLQ